MRLSSARDFKAEVSGEVVEAGGEALRPFYGSTEPPMPDGIGIGITKASVDEYRPVIYAPSLEAAKPYVDRAAGEADVRVVAIAKRATPGYFQADRAILEPGVQVGMAGENFVGTLGCFVRDAAGVLYALSNAHVLSNESLAQPGRAIGQPFGSSKHVATYTRDIPLSFAAPNLVDVAMARVDSRRACVLGWTQANQRPIRGVRTMTAEEVGRPLFKAGRTTGVTVGALTVAELDGVAVRYDRGLARFNDQVEITGTGLDFSAPGDSGSLIVDADGWAVALLFAGGVDSGGIDRTYGNRIQAALDALGVTLA